MRPAKEANSKGSWDQTLNRFKSQLDILVQNGQPSGGVVPETALAEINKIVKEDLKRSVSAVFTAFAFIFSLFCQSGNNRSRERKPERGDAPGM